MNISADELLSFRLFSQPATCDTLFACFCSAWFLNVLFCLRGWLTWRVLAGAGGDLDGEVSMTLASLLIGWVFIGYTFRFTTIFSVLRRSAVSSLEIM